MSTDLNALHDEDAKEIYRRICRLVPLRYDPHLVRDEPQCEALVTCWCGARCRVIVNGDVPTLCGLRSVRLWCRNCGRSLDKAYSVAGHSGGIFNTVVFSLSYEAGELPRVTLFHGSQRDKVGEQGDEDYDPTSARCHS